MDRDISAIREEALSLDAESRAHLMDDLAASLGEEDTFFNAQLDEAERRWRSIESGEAKTYPAEQVVREVRERIRR